MLFVLALVGCGGDDGASGDGSPRDGASNGTGGTAANDGPGNVTGEDGESMGGDAAPDGGSGTDARDDRLRGDVLFEMGVDPGDPDGTAIYAFARFLDPSGSPDSFGSDEPSRRVGDCYVYRDDEPGDGESDADEQEPASRSRYLSAGEVLTLSTSDGTLGEFQRSGEPGDYRYWYGTEAVPIGRALPRGVVLDVPGDEFPAFSALAVPYVDPMIVRSPATGASVGPDVVIEWDPSGTGDGEVVFYLQSYDYDRGIGIGVSCLVPDTGAYSLSPEVIAALDPLPEGLPSRSGAA